MTTTRSRDGLGGAILPELGFATKSERIYDALRDAILNGSVEAGSRINLSRTAQQLGASETPVREALKRLESERLVRVEPHAGFVVTDVSLADLIENLVLRREVEAVATCLAAKSMTPNDFEELRALVDRMAECAERSDWATYSALNKRFHRELIDRCPLPVVRRTAIELWEVGERSRSLFVRKPSFESNLEHRAMLDAMEAGDLDALASLVRRQKTVSIRIALDLLGDVVPESADGAWTVSTTDLLSLEESEE